MTKTVVSPFLRWAGSKRQLIPTLLSYWRDDFHRYVEPFVGSACLFFAVAQETALLGDINAELIATLTAVRDDPGEVSKNLQSIPLGESSYYRLRATSPEGLSLVDRATRFIFLNRFCFNGLYRTNSKGQFNVPYSAQKTGQLPTCEHLVRAGEALGNAEIRCTDFEDLLQDVGEGDFVYLDPPYAVNDRRVFREYHPESFALSDLARLQRCLRRLDNNGAVFLVSYADSPIAHETLVGWHTQEVQVRRNIAGFSSSRKIAREVLYSNSAPVGGDRC